MKPINPSVLEKVQQLPNVPGVYRFINKSGKIIYIGKAKNLRNRVRSYFRQVEKHSFRIQRLVENIRDLAYTITNSEIEALVLENNLIKHHQPRYNILLKDGKTYPYICVKEERFPRVFSTRRKLDDGSLYFGPYPNGKAMRTLLDLIAKLYPLRNCNYTLSESNIRAKKFKVCLEYQIGNCAGPCEGKLSVDIYHQNIEAIKHILKGNLNPIFKALTEQMQEYAQAFQFEEAQETKERIELLKAYKRKNTIVSNKIDQLEVLTVLVEEHLGLVNHFKVQHGTITQTHSWELKRRYEESESEILEAAIGYLLSEGVSLHKEIITNVLPSKQATQLGYTFQVPKIGEKKHLVDLSEKNCKTLIIEKLYKQTFKKPSPTDTILLELKRVLHLSEIPIHIECFDNSNTQGSFPVASLVVFKNGKPTKKDYRHFNIKTVEGPNDFASMEEVVKRRYKRLLEEDVALPQLIMVDGGKGQLSSAAQALKSLGLLSKVPLIGIAKRLEEIYVLDDPIPLHIDKKSPALKLLQRIRNEAHRFAITFHRNQRSRGQNQDTALKKIPGIGSKTAQKLLIEYRSLKKLKEATHKELQEKFGAHIARLLVDAKSKNII